MERIVDCLEKQASTQVAAKKLDSKLQLHQADSRQGAMPELKATISRVRFWDADGS